MLLLAAIFGAGVLHGVGPDHLAAITAFAAAVEHDLRRMVIFATRFAIAHALVIAVAGLAGHFGRLLLAPNWERRFDIAAGGLLIFTGVAAAVGVAAGKIKIHGHPHLHRHDAHSHYHLHLARRREQPEHSAGRHSHVHGALAATLGVLFALGGVRSLIAVVPMAVAGTLSGTVLRLALFISGIVLAMVGYAVFAQHAFDRLADRAAAAGRAPAFFALSSYLLAAFCVVAGIMTIRERLPG